VASKFIDSHAHLDDQRFDKDRDEVIRSLYENEVEAVLNPGSDLNSSKEALAMEK
jgi:TatD DNase family protein